MAKKTIGEAVINVVVKGWEAAKTGLDKLKSGLESLHRPANLLAGYFTVLSGTIAKTVSLASPQDWAELEGAIGALSVEIGRIFIPLLRQVTEWLKQAVKWFASLTDGQRENILYWGKVALAVGLVGVALAAILPIISAIMAHPFIFGFAAALAAAAVAAAAVAKVIGELEKDKERAGTPKKEDIELYKKRKAEEEQKQGRTLTDKEFGEQHLKTVNEELGRSSFSLGLRNIGSRLGLTGESTIQESATLANVGRRAADAGGIQNVRTQEKPKDTNAFRPNERFAAPQLSSLTDAWARAQTAVQQGTELSAEQQRRQYEDNSLTALRTIANNTARGQGAAP